ncbi:MAG: tRNA lysidine(34) synthetase TilS [Clostridia bacterium]|nr:tRNA lysidine(34) synthetase TilS [Clostridia bacterium]
MNNISQQVKKKVASALTDFAMLQSANEVVVGFSGGADSVCLLHVLNQLKGEFGFSLTAAHVNHGLRGDEALRDAEFSEAFCKENSISFKLLNADCPAEVKKTGESFEECGRRIRYDFFNSLCSSESKIATAHNSNDNAETVIFNIVRGASLNGACGIPPVRDNIIRPLLFCSRAEIEGYCKENNLRYMTDSTNLSVDYSRNKIRHLVLPVLEEINSGAINNINSFSSFARSVNSFVNKQVSDVLSKSRIDDNSYKADLILQQDISICKQCIVEAYFRFSAKSIDSMKIDFIYSLLSNGGRLQLFGNEFVEVIKGVLRFYKNKELCAAEQVFIEALPFTYKNELFNVEIVKYTNSLKKINKLVLDNLVDCDKIVGKICLRTRKNGDFIRLPRRNVSKSLKKLFSEMNVPVEIRDNVPVLADDEGVIWVCYVGVAERCKVDDGSTNIVYVRGENNE